jgi:hypothetical protein
MKIPDMKFSPTQWCKQTPAIIDNIFHLYSFAWMVWLMIAGSKFLVIPDHTALVISWISGLFLPILYAFCRCFGVKVPADIPAENTVPVTDPRMQDIITKMDNLSASIGKVTSDAPDISTWLHSLSACKTIADFEVFITTIPKSIIEFPGFEAMLVNTRKALGITAGPAIVTGSNPITGISPKPVTLLDPEVQEQLDSLKLL